MSVYIPGMEMPTSCWRCEIGNAEQMDNRPCPFYSIDGEEQEKYADSRHPNCPLVPVPPHGRLIDADALIAWFEEWYDPNADLEICHVVDILDDNSVTPTIIEAEEGE